MSCQRGVYGCCIIPVILLDTCTVYRPLGTCRPVDLWLRYLGWDLAQSPRYSYSAQALSFALAQSENRGTSAAVRLDLLHVILPESTISRTVYTTNTDAQHSWFWYALPRSWRRILPSFSGPGIWSASSFHLCERYTPRLGAFVVHRNGINCK